MQCKLKMVCSYELAVDIVLYVDNKILSERTLIKILSKVLNLAVMTRAVKEINAKYVRTCI